MSKAGNTHTVKVTVERTNESSGAIPKIELSGTDDGAQDLTEDMQHLSVPFCERMRKELLSSDRLTPRCTEKEPPATGTTKSLEVPPPTPVRRDTKQTQSAGNSPSRMTMKQWQEYLHKQSELRARLDNAERAENKYEMLTHGVVLAIVIAICYLIWIFF